MNENEWEIGDRRGAEEGGGGGRRRKTSKKQQKKYVRDKTNIYAKF